MNAKIDKLIKDLMLLSDQEKEALLSVLNKNSTTDSISHNTFNINDYKDVDEVKKASKIDKILKENRKPISLPTRKKDSLVEVACINCGKKYLVSSSFPNIHKFICCIK